MRIILVLMMAILAACQSAFDPKEVADGGPCTYKETPFTFTVIEVKKMPPQNKSDTLEQYNVLAVLNADASGGGISGNRAGDTLYYFRDRGKYATKAYITGRNVKPGRVFTGVEQHIKTGSCNPHIIANYWED